ncbi:MAG: slipin family protein [Phycisphaerales bacterium]|nr:slipin family protein [Phycisphaerales bacterium]
MLWRKIRIRKHELGLWFQHGDFHKLLMPGAYRFMKTWPWRKRNFIEIVDTLEPRFEHKLIAVLVKLPVLAVRLKVIDLKDDERALVWIDGRLGAILAGGLHAFWNAPAEIFVERFDVNDLRFTHPKLDAVLTFTGAARYLNGLRVESHERVLVFRDGELIERLGPGHFVYWRSGSNVTWKTVDLREQVADVAGQEILTQDKVTLRMNLFVMFRVTDAEKAVTSVADHVQALYREAQLALRAAVGTRPLDRLLADKDEVGAEIRNQLASRTAQFGVTVSGVGLRDLILPGDMKVILNEVIVAQKQAEANLIRRREETAAARSQANTAKLLAENPVLARMKELEALQDILSNANATFVFGNTNLTDQVRSLVTKNEP